MASRKVLKKQVTYIAGELFSTSLVEGIDRDAVMKAVENVLQLIPRISHTEPGNVKSFYKQFHADLNKEIKAVADELEKVANKAK